MRRGACAEYVSATRAKKYRRYKLKSMDTRKVHSHNPLHTFTHTHRTMTTIQSKSTKNDGKATTAKAHRRILSGAFAHVQRAAHRESEHRSETGESQGNEAIHSEALLTR